MDEEKRGSEMWSWEPWYFNKRGDQEIQRKRNKGGEVNMPVYSLMLDGKIK